MAYFSDLLPILMAAQQFQPPGSPVMRPLPKAQSNVTATPNPAVRLPPDYATTMLNAANTFSEMPLRMAQARQAGLQSQFLQSQINAMPAWQKLIDSMGNGGSGGAVAPAVASSGGGEVGSPAPNAEVGDGGGKAVSSTTADDTLPPEARALLDTISGPESGGAYNVRWGGPSGDKTFDSYSAHPNIPEPGPQGDSTAAGRYQIVHKTWEPLAEKYGFADFQPKTQDQAAWHLAADTYKDNTGRDLLTDLQNGDTSRVAGALHGQWSTLRMGSYDQNLAKYEKSPTQVAQADTGTVTDATPAPASGAISPDAWAAMGGTGAPPSVPAPAGKLPSRIGLDKDGPDAKMIDLETGQPIDLAATPATKAPPITGVGAPLPGPQLPVTPAAVKMAQNMPPRPAQTPQAPQAMPPAPMPMIPNGGTTFGTGLDPVALAKLGAMSELYHLPNVAGPLAQAYYNSPAYKAALADAEARVKLGYAGPMAEATKRVDLQYAPQIAAATKKAELPFTPINVRQGGAVGTMTPEGGFNLAFQNPHLPMGGQLEQGPNGQLSVAMAPNAANVIQQSATAQAAGPAAYRPTQVPGPFGREYTTTDLNLANSILAGRGAPGAAPQVVPGTNMATPLPIAPPAAAQSTPTQQRVEAAAPTAPVQTPSGTKDLSALSVADMFPNGQGIPKPPAPPPGMTYGKPSETEVKSQEDDASRLEGYDKEASENQKIYQDVGHLRDIIQRGVTTSTISPAMAELGNIAQGLGLPASTILQKFDPNDLAVFNKASTDLVFAAVKKLAGAVKVAEIEGYRQASPSVTLPGAANISILNDVLSTGKWQDVRAKLAHEYVTSTGGAPLAAFDAKYNQMAPLVDVTQAYKDAMRSTPQYQAGLRNGLGFAEDLRQPAPQNAPGEPRRLRWDPAKKMAVPY